MAQNTQLDSLEFDRLSLPYNRIERELSEEPRLVLGQNTYVTVGGKLVKRPGLIKIANSESPANSRIARLWMYETMETPSKVYIMASMWDGATSRYKMYYLRLDGGAVWTSLGSYRGVDASTRPHELCVSRGLAFIKSFPAAGDAEKIGSVIFDGTVPAVRPWGIPGPTTAARITGVMKKLVADITAAATTFDLNSVDGLPVAPFNIQIDYETMTVTDVTGTTLTVLRGAQGTTPAAHATNTFVFYRDWTASTHPVTVNLGWKYSYAYKSITGHVSNRVDVERNPDNLPSSTGPFINMRPKITVQGHADTTNIPTIVIYRTTDGGGTFYELKEITNTGAGEITFEDKWLASGGGATYEDPVPDAQLDTQSFAPSLTSNSIPPTTLAPLVSGVDPVQPSTRVVSYASRLWYAIGNVLFFSGQEEISVGIPEESFPSGIKGRFFRFQHQIVNLEATTDALYIITTKTVYILQGTTRETFNPRPFLYNIGGRFDHSGAITRFGEAIAWLTHDFRVAVVKDKALQVITDPLGTDVVDAINAGAEVEIRYWAELEKEFIIVSAHRPDSVASSKTWVYDIKLGMITQKDFWHTPWIIPSLALASDPVRETQKQNRLVFAVQDATGGHLTYLDPTGVASTDDYPANAATPINMRAVTNLFMLPPGNHVNALRRPELSPVLHEFVVERTKFTGDADPTISYYMDDLWTTPLTSPTESPATRPASKGYSTLVFPIHETCKRFALDIASTNNNYRVEIQGILIAFNPDGGA